MLTWSGQELGNVTWLTHQVVQQASKLGDVHTIVTSFVFAYLHYDFKVDMYEMTCLNKPREMKSG